MVLGDILFCLEVFKKSDVNKKKSFISGIAI